MSKIKNGGLDQYGAGPFKQQQFGTAGVEGVNRDTERDSDVNTATQSHKHAYTCTNAYTLTQ